MPVDRNLEFASPLVAFVLLLGGLPALAAAQHVGPEFYERLDALPELEPGVSAHYVSSYDRTGGNDDGFRGTHSALYEDERGEHVLFDEAGPGCVYNLWFTDRRGPTSELEWGRLRFYFDGEEEPRIDLDANDFFSGRAPGLPRPFVTHNYISSGGYACALPFCFRERLKITSERRVGFYNVYYQLYEEAEVQSWTGREELGSLSDIFERRGSTPIRGLDLPDTTARHVALSPCRDRKNPPTAVLVELEAAGRIESLRINPLFDPDAYTLNHTHLRITFDGAEQPAVDVPLGPFFGSGLGPADVRSLLFGMSTSGSYYCHFPMPFERSVRVELVNHSHDGGGEYHCEVDVRATSVDPPVGAERGQFFAIWNQALPAIGDEDYVLLDLQGRGKVVANVMTVVPVAADRKRWWEGDLRVWIDGEDTPRMHGTGHEDEYQGGWSSFWLSNPYSLPLVGQPKTADLVDVFGQINGSTTMYRIWPGGIPFDSSIRMSTEHGNGNDSVANYSSVVMGYRIAAAAPVVLRREPPLEDGAR